MYVYNISKYELCSSSSYCAISMNALVLKNRGGGGWLGVSVGPGNALQMTSCVPRNEKISAEDSRAF